MGICANAVHIAVNELRLNYWRKCWWTQVQMMSDIPQLVVRFISENFLILGWTNWSLPSQMSLTNQNARKYLPGKGCCPCFPHAEWMEMWRSWFRSVGSGNPTALTSLVPSAVHLDINSSCSQRCPLLYCFYIALLLLNLQDICDASAGCSCSYFENRVLHQWKLYSTHPLH